MDDAVKQLLERYQCKTHTDYHNALKEIVQELALFGLWRNKFFEHAAFYGGTALRILHGLNRFSEDLDFSLLKADPHFRLENYELGIRRELEALGFTLQVEVKEKNVKTAVQSAFLKGNTLEHLLKIGLPEMHIKSFHPGEKIKVKFEIDTDPPQDFQTEAVPLFLPIPFSVRTYKLPDMFAGKISALLFRQWHNRVKGRDWYDFLWFIGKRVPVNLEHLHRRLVQIDHTLFKNKLTLADVKKMIHEKTDGLNLNFAKQDIFPFIQDPRQLDGWTKELFHAAVEKLEAV